MRSHHSVALAPHIQGDSIPGTTLFTLTTQCSAHDCAYLDSGTPCAYHLIMQPMTTADFDTEETTVTRAPESMRAVMQSFGAAMRAASDAGIAARDAYAVHIAANR